MNFQLEQDEIPKFLFALSLSASANNNCLPAEPFRMIFFVKLLTFQVKELDCDVNVYIQESSLKTEHSNKTNPQVMDELDRVETNKSIIIIWFYR